MTFPDGPDFQAIPEGLYFRSTGYYGSAKRHMTASAYSPWTGDWWADYNRPDLKTAFANQPAAEWAGFRARLPAAEFAANNQYRFRISAQTRQAGTFHCIVVYTLGNSGSSPWTIRDGVLYV